MIRLSLEHRQGSFSLDVDASSRGPVVGIFGPSGSGKTTLLHAVAGLVRPRRAHVEVWGVVVAKRPGRIWIPPERRRFALVPQDALLFPHLSVRSNLTFAPGARAELSESYGRQVLEILRLESLLDRNARSLSGGERQRIALGRALLSRPRLLLLDEPVASLDAELAREVLALLLEAKRELEVPMLFVTHRAAEMLALADDCLVLEAGRIVAQGTPLDVLAHPRTLGVAHLVGVDNLLRRPVVSHDVASGLTFVNLGTELVLATPLCGAGHGEWIDVGIYAEDVILCREAPSATSARNALAARVDSLDPVGHEVLVRLTVGDVSMVVRVTPGAVRELRLERGQDVVALIKTTACHHLSAKGASFVTK